MNQSATKTELLDQSVIKSILDASALITLLTDEQRAEPLLNIIGSSVISTLTLTEAIKNLCKFGNNPIEAFEKISLYVKSIIPYTEDKVLKVVSLDSLGKLQISLEELSALGLALEYAVPLYTMNDKLINLNATEIKLL